MSLLYVGHSLPLIRGVTHILSPGDVYPRAADPDYVAACDSNEVRRAHYGRRERHFPVVPPGELKKRLVYQEGGAFDRQAWQLFSSEHDGELVGEDSVACG